MTTLVIADLSTAERSQFEKRDRERAVEAARAAGRIGLSRIPDQALFPGGLDPSDSCVIAVLDAYLAGQLERCK